MTTQTSPFQLDADNTSSAPTVSNADEFSFHTMPDDLEAMKNGTFVISDKESVPKQSPVTEVAPAPSMPAQNPTRTAPTDYSKNPSPFFSQPVIPRTERETPKAFSPSPTPYKLEDTTEETKPIETFSQKQPIQNFSSPTPAQSTSAPTAPLEKKEIPIVEIPTMESSSDDNSVSGAYKIIIAVIIVLIISILILGGYYFWITSKATPAVEPTPVAESPIKEQTPAVEEVPVVVEAPTEKYSQTKPNYLTLDISTVGAEEIKTSLSSIATELKDKTASSAYEFLVVDKNNNPVAFSVFAAATKMNLSQGVLSALNKDFSLFFYNDNGNIRLGLAVSTQNKDSLTKELAMEEKTLPADIALMFLDTKPEIQTGWVFKDGSYGAYKTRYLNLNAQGTLSIDYTLTENKFVIGTSMKTMHAIVDQSKVVTSTQAPATSPQDSAMKNTEKIPGDSTADLLPTNTVQSATQSSETISNTTN